ncbi:MAG: hypothetical protein QXQ58_00045 [Candidatus Aenigmatarchaeota archaeon]
MHTIGIKEISILFLLFPVVLAQERTENLFFIYETFSYPAKINVLEKNQNIEIGISGDTWILDFGQIYVGMGSRKYINITVNEEYKVILKSSGNISSLIKFEKNNFILKGQTEIPIYIEPKKPGYYTGEVKILFKKIKYPFLNWLLKCV